MNRTNRTEFKTLNAAPETPNPKLKPQTLNPKTLNPKAVFQVRGQVLLAGVGRPPEVRAGLVHAALAETFLSFDKLRV